jgi:hypothetical protein
MLIFIGSDAPFSPVFVKESGDTDVSDGDPDEYRSCGDTRWLRLYAGYASRGMRTGIMRDIVFQTQVQCTPDS